LNHPVKVLVVETRDSERFISRRLQDKHARDLAWHTAASECDLRKIAQDFNPGIVFCADEMLPGCRDGALDLLQLLSLQAAKILIAEVGDGLPSWDLTDASSPHTPAHAAVPPAAAAEEHAEPATPWPLPLPAILETSWDAVVLSDGAGWITHANSKACEILGETAGKHLGTLLGTGCDFAAKGRRLHRLGFFDAVTGLPSPAHTSELTGRILARTRDEHAALPVAALDLSGLRLMSEERGHAISDAVLDAIAGELQSGAVGCGMVARVGADDVLVMLPDPCHPSDAVVNVCAAGRSAVRSAEPSPAAANPLPAPEDASLLDAGLQNALTRQTIGVHYQPQYELQSGRGIGVQALARWFLTNGDVIAPAEFIPVAERAGMIDTLGAQVLKSACDRAAAWRGRDLERLTVSVNVSNLQITESFSAVVAGILKSSGVAATRLELEIAESALLANRETTIRCLTTWKQMGVRIALNLSGKDASSLAYLAKIPVDRLKLDRSLIHRMTLTSNDAGMVRSLIKIAEVHEIAVIAHGVETEAQFQMLLNFGCPQAQGFLFARPMSGVHALLALRKPWGNLAKSVARPIPAEHAS
jgi:EAL domain-containing protein (putative c-di-GMP-specific phosphodiesterase class I)/PAS domain-containing protein